MPIYEYHCKKCGADFEALVPNQSAKVKCEKCASSQVVKKLSTFTPQIAGACPGAKDCSPLSHPCGRGPGAGGCACGCSGHHHH